MCPRLWVAQFLQDWVKRATENVRWRDGFTASGAEHQTPFSLTDESTSISAIDECRSISRLELPVFNRSDREQRCLLCRCDEQSHFYGKRLFIQMVEHQEAVDSDDGSIATDASDVSNKKVNDSCKYSRTAVSVWLR
jgi:hypothetical protein